MGLEDLLRLAKYCQLPGIDGPGKWQRQEVLEALANHFGKDDEDYKAQVLKAPDELKPVDLLVDDPMFETTFEEMPEDDRQELQFVKRLVTTRRLKRDVAARAAKRQGVADQGPPRKRRRFSREVPQAKAPQRPKRLLCNDCQGNGECPKP